MTLLEVVNRTLRRLREDEVTSVANNSYSKLIADFVVEIREQMMDDHDWSGLYHTVPVQLASGTYVYDLSATVTDGGNVANGNRVTNLDSELAFDPNGGVNAYWYEDSSATEPKAELIVVDPRYMQKLRLEDIDSDTASYFYATFYQNEDGLTMEVFPTPTENRYVRVEFYTPLTELAVDGTDDNTELQLPWRPVFLGALFLAFNERGEEIGEPGAIAERRYKDALDTAVQADMKLRERTNTYEAYRD